MVKSETQESNLLAFEFIWSPTWNFTGLWCPRETYIFEQWDRIKVIWTLAREAKLKVQNSKGYIISYTYCWHPHYKWELDL